ncbi:MAG: GNAT family N-acetyltransferase, partial [Anaerolineales bacterium]|nr:GNAT family N-acetyltransferase [Anaerolineales bacterium]
MTEKELRIEHIKVQQLPAFAERVIRTAQPGQFVPISMQRAVAHAQNPYADPDDVGLLVAIDEDDEVVGYFGIMPMLLRVGDTHHKTHWFTTWSVSSKVRGRGVGSMLMKEALTLNLDFLIVGSVHARRVCQRYGFWERDPLKYYWLQPSGMGNLNPLTAVLRLARKTAHLLKLDREIAITNAGTRWLERTLSPLTKPIFYPLLTAKLAPLFKEFNYREVPQIGEQWVEIKNRPHVELHRGPQAVNWMLNYPWIVENGQSQTEDLDYYFSDARPLYRLVALEVTDPKDGTYLGFVVFSISQKASGIALKTLDFCFGDP